jgi:DNA repair protein RadA/Sms
MKTKTGYVCTDCGATYTKWQGHCAACNAWNTVKEVRLGDTKPGRRDGYAGVKSSVTLLGQVEVTEQARFSSGIEEFDRVLGGGFVLGSVVLIGGDPGAGKSTILLQTMCNAADSREVLYVSGEESLQQIATRAARLQLPTNKVKMLAESSVERVLDAAESEKPDIVVIDSIQVMQSATVDAAAGGVSQVRECAGILTCFAKTSGVVLIMVGHVTKDSAIAGPMTLSHMVDTQIMLSSTEDARYRLMRTTKNRFGAVNELAIFSMTERGLRQVKNPSAIFLSRSDKASPGSLISVLWEGTRPLLLEIQALVVTAQFGNPRRLGIGLDQNRIAMILAVLAKHGGLVLYDQDIFVNLVGGTKTSETSTDLAVALAIVSSLQNKTLPQDLVVFGEVGLTGEIRPVANGEARLKESSKHGFTRAIVPKGNLPKQGIGGMQIIRVADLNEALDAIYSLNQV